MVQNNRLRLHALTSFAKNIDIGNYECKKYKHFDNSISIHKVIENILNPCWITQHDFFPFIHYEIRSFKYSDSLKAKSSEKIRDIYYASHLDSYIYKYYGDILNNKYNDLTKDLMINETVTAYRNNLRGKNNIHFAKEAVNFIVSNDRAFIYVADFTNFFDSLDHKYLKKQLERVLGEKRLPDDHYTVFKNITKFSWVDREKIDLVLKKKYKTRDRIRNATRRRYFDAKDFRRFRNSDKNNIETNINNYGIPQGAGLSSVYSNIYLLDFDKVLNQYIQKYKGIYRRYCDDLIIIIPIKGSIKDYNYKKHLNYIEEIKDTIPRLSIQQEKTGVYFYENEKILNRGLECSKLNYLGFSFDGKNVRIREKSMFKFYNKAYRKVKLCNINKKKHGRKKNRRQLYRYYTHLGKSVKGHGNFLTYASRAQKIFDEDLATNNLMELQVKNHWKYINNRLK